MPLRSQNLIPLTSGAYQARDAIANYLICENLFPELNPEDAGPDVPVTHYPREGKRFLSAPPTPGRGRGVFCASNGALFAVVGQSVYAIDASWTWTLLGTLSYPLSTPVSMSDNGTTAVFVDGSPLGYTVSLVATSGIIGTLGAITGGTGGTAGAYTDVTLTGGAGTLATATITVAGGAVTQVVIVNPGRDYLIGDSLSANSADIGNVVGFSVLVASLSSTTANGGFAPIVDPTGTFVGATRADFADTFMAFNTPGTNGWLVSNPNSITFNALQVANKDSSPDPIVTLAFNLRQAWLIGAKGTEVWFLAGSIPFPYQEWPSTFVPYGCVAPYSLVQADINLFWLSRNPQGQALAVKAQGYAVKAFSTRALEYEWSTYTRVDDCIGMTFQQGGHTFIIFHFPTADVTWGYDLGTEQWHKRTFIDKNGIPHRESVAFCASVGGYRAPESAIAPTPQLGYPTTIVGQDWSNGSIYALDPKFFTDNGAPIVFRRTFPHQMADMREVTHVSFVADFATGQASGLIGSSGFYRSMMRWRGLGMARDRVYELMWVYPGPSALQGAYLEPIEHSA